MWYDKVNSKWCEIGEFPTYRTKYADGKITHNFGDAVNIKAVNEAVSAVEEKVI